MVFKTAHSRIFFIFLAILWIPFLQQKFSITKSGTLHGYNVLHHHIPFTWKGWWDGTYQNNENDFLNDSMGYRTMLLRLNNQLDYSLFKKVHAKGIVIGKDNYLYETGYIDDYCGVNYVGDITIKNKLAQLKKIQDTLTKLGKTLLVVYAPSKVYYCPEHLPDSMRCAEAVNSNYKSYVRISDSLGINDIDCNGWLRGLKGERDNIFTRPGTHWTAYGAQLATDSIVRYISRVRNIRMPRAVSRKITRTTIPQAQEWDLEAAFNLLFRITKDTFTHQEVVYSNDSTLTRPSIILIGDSFGWTIVGNDLLKPISNNWEFWYYFGEVYNQKITEGIEPGKKIAEYNWMNKILHKDVIILLYTTENLPVFGNGFIEQSYKYFDL